MKGLRKGGPGSRTAPTSSVCQIQWGVTLRKAWAEAYRCGVCRLDQVASRRTGRWREETDGWDLYAGTSLASP